MTARGRYKKIIGSTQKEAVELYFFEKGLTVDDIMVKLHCPRESIRARICEIRKERKEYFAN